MEHAGIPAAKSVPTQAILGKRTSKKKLSYLLIQEGIRQDEMFSFFFSLRHSLLELYTLLNH